MPLTNLDTRTEALLVWLRKMEANARAVNSSVLTAECAAAISTVTELRAEHLAQKLAHVG